MTTVQANVDSCQRCQHEVVSLEGEWPETEKLHTFTAGSG
jgi:hypothetical protein